MEKDIPILDCFSGEGVINKNSYVVGNIKCLNAIEIIKKYNINTALMIFSLDIFKDIRQSDKLEEFYEINLASNINKCYVYDKKFVIALSPLGGAAANGLMEELGFFGITNFFACGSAGQVDENLDTTKFVLVEKAIRDEGSSYHYLEPSTYTYTTEKTNKCLEKFLSDNGYEFVLGTTWTTDAFYRETPTAIEKRKQQGAVCVEMECASWCAVAKFRNYNFSQLLYFSDAVKQDAWKWHTTKEELKVSVINLMIDFVNDFLKNNN